MRRVLQLEECHTIWDFQSWNHDTFKEKFDENVQWKCRGGSERGFRCGGAYSTIVLIFIFFFDRYSRLSLFFQYRAAFLPHHSVSMHQLLAVRRHHKTLSLLEMPIWRYGDGRRSAVSRRRRVSRITFSLAMGPITVTQQIALVKKMLYKRTVDVQ